MLPEEGDQNQVQFNNKALEWISYVAKKIPEIEERLNKIEQQVGNGSAQAIWGTEDKASAEPPRPPYLSPDKRFAPEALANQTKPAEKKESLESEIGLKWLGRIGVVALIFGLAFFLKYAFDNNWIEELGRVILGVAGGLAMIGLGELLRKRYALYAQILTGGGIAILYLSVYAAFGFYDLISKAAALAIMGAITFFAGLLAIHYEGQALAGLGIFGGFLTPLLLSAGADNELVLFSYIIILDLGILGVSFFRKWRKLNLLAFLGTFFIFFEWFAMSYTNSQLFITEFFLTIFFLIFAIATVTHNIVLREQSDKEDLILVSVNALSYFSISYYLLDPEYHSFMGLFAVIMSLFYCCVALISFKYNSEDKYLALSLPGLASLFIILAVPIQLDGNWITIGWAAEGAILAWLGFSLNNYSMRVFALTAFTLSIVRLVGLDSSIEDIKNYWVIFNKRFLTYLLVILSGLGIYGLYCFFSSLSNKDERRVKGAILLICNLLFIGILSSELITYYDQKMANLFYPVLEQCGGYYSNRIYAPQGSSDCERQQALYENALQEKSLKIESITNTQKMALSIFWAIYAIIVSIVGIIIKNKPARLFGIGLFGLTIVKLFIFDLWNLGTLYRIISSFSLGAILLLVSFAYNKYKDRIKEII